ncbi:MAG: hypothetical protein JWN75_1001 [Candidatus Saccharibacteria bacterium]|nr:hypothetical protein [Candidatus Saccharibacteria bacterium]
MNKQHKQTTNDKRGFTIIEVVLVLAIAGLIFLMVFLALPALQRGQRDTQRKDDLSRINTQLQNYQSSNRGSIPSESKLIEAGSGFVTRYLNGPGAQDSARQAGGEYVDPTSGEGYRFTTGTVTDIPQGTINYQTGMLCGTDGDVTNGSGRQYALRTKLENQSAYYCIDNR